jgi:hypothetical protein
MNWQEFFDRHKDDPSIEELYQAFKARLEHEQFNDVWSSVYGTKDET